MQLHIPNVGRIVPRRARITRWGWKTAYNYPSLSDIQTQPFPIAPGETGLALNYDLAHPDQVSDVWFGKSGYLYQLTASDDGFSELLPFAHTTALF